MSTSRFRVIFGIVLLTALLLRIGAVYSLRPGSEEYERLYIFGDPRVYHQLAIIFQKDGITDEFRRIVAVYAPAYPILLGITYKLFGVNLIPPLILNILISVFNCAIIMLLTRKTFGEQASIVAGFLFALHPHSIRFTAMLYSETWFMLITSIFVLGLLYTQYPDKKRWLGFAIITLAAAIGAFSRISMLYFSILAVLTWFIGSKMGWRSITKRLAIFLVSYIVCLSPWMIYNKIHNDTFRLSVSGEYNLLALVVSSSKADDIDTFYRIRRELVGVANERAKRDGVNNPYDKSKYYLDVAFEEIFKNPGRFIFSQFKGIFNFWFRPVMVSSSRRSELTESSARIVYYIYYSYIFQIFLFLAWIALFFEKGRIPPCWKALSVVAVIYFAITVGNAAYSRFFLHALPYVIPVAAVNIVSFYDWLRKSALNRADPTISR